MSSSLPEPAERPLAPLTPVDSGRRTLIRGATLVTMDEQIGNHRQGDILIEGDRILDVGSELPDAGGEVIDASDMIIIPGFVDTHRHAWEGQLRRINPNSADLEDYCNATHFSFARFYRPRDNYIGNLITAIGCIDAGITTIIDNSHNSRSPSHSDAAAGALRDSGIRALFAPGAPLSGDWDQASWPRDLERLKAAMAADESNLVTLAMMAQIDREAWAFARGLDLKIVTEFFGRSMASELESLHREGLLGPDNIFNHCTGVPEEGWEIIREAGVNINVCPRSDAHYALEDGMCAFQIALDYDMRPGLSVDNETSYSGDMFTEMRVAFYLQRSVAQGRKFLGNHNYPQPVLVSRLLEAATIDGARCAGLSTEIGSLTPGKNADLVMIRTDDVNLYPSNHALGTVVHAAERSNVDSVMIGGRFRKRDGQVVGLDRSKLKRLTEESREHLFEAAGYRPDIFCDFHPKLSESASQWVEAG